MSHSDSSFFKTFAIVLVGLVAFFAFIVTVASMNGLDRQSSADMAKVLAERTSPAGRVVTSDEAEVLAAAVVPAGPAKPEDLYAQACAACHDSGIAGAPKFGDSAAWEARKGLGLDELVKSVIHGKGAMPARGGSALSDDEIRTVVEYMAGF